MPIKIEMPRLSDTMQAGTVVKWNVKEGQKVKSGDVLADIETDKATMELPTYEDGTVAAIVVSEGQNVPIGTVILLLAGAGEDPAAVKAQGGVAQAGAKAERPQASAVGGSTRAAAPGGGVPAVLDPTEEEAGEPDSNEGAEGVGQRDVHERGGNGQAHRGNGRIFASPLARKIAEESGVDLAEIQGTGPSGRIIRRDVEEALSRGAAAPAARAASGATSKAGAGAAPKGGAGTALRSSPLPPMGSTLKGEVHPLSNMRRVIARRLVESKTTIPHYQVTVEVDLEPLLALRGQLNEQLESQGVKLSVNDFLVRACALAMHQHPFVNSRWTVNNNQEAIETLADVNIGVAIALDQSKGGGLVVATIRAADQIGLRQISTQTRQLAEKARGKGLSPDEMSDSTFTISNLGMFGVSHFTAIINPPNACILAVGAALDRPVVKDGKVVPGKVMSMTMSSDHRIVDGAMAAQYLATLKELLEKPATLLV